MAGRWVSAPTVNNKLAVNTIFRFRFGSGLRDLPRASIRVRLQGDCHLKLDYEPHLVPLRTATRHDDEPQKQAPITLYGRQRQSPCSSRFLAFLHFHHASKCEGTSGHNSPPPGYLERISRKHCNFQRIPAE